jgi:low temperature requirement protein LtrA
MFVAMAAMLIVSICVQEAFGNLALASLFDGLAQGALWALAIFLDMAGPYFFGAEGWTLVPGHFAERHGLIVIIARGESIVAIGVGASGTLDLGIGAAAVLGVFLAAALWWTYFDVVALISARRLGEAEPGRVRNELARDSYSYIHLLTTVTPSTASPLGLAIVLLLPVPVATAVPALISVIAADVLIWTMVAYEHRGYGPRREELRHEAKAL